MTLKAFLAALLLATATPAVPAAAEFDRTCAYFSNVAYNDRFTRENLTFRIRLADDCADALAVLNGARPGSVRHALSASYLQRLEDYRRVMIGMALERFRASRAGARTVHRPVTRSGAFLIARVMGVADTHTRWRAWRQAMAEGRVLIR